MEVIQNNTAPQGENLSVWGYFVRCLTTKYSDFSGRARRKEWWSFALFNVLISSLLSIPMGVTLVKDMTSDPEMAQHMAQNPGDTAYVYSLLGSNVFFWALLIRRDPAAGTDAGGGLSSLPRRGDLLRTLLDGWWTVDPQ